MANGGAGINQVPTGLCGDYRRGAHRQGSPTAHGAFKQREGRPIRRTKDDLDFNASDMAEFMNPFDNQHAAWRPSVARTDRHRALEGAADRSSITLQGQRRNWQ